MVRCVVALGIACLITTAHASFIGSLFSGLRSKRDEYKKQLPEQATSANDEFARQTKIAIEGRDADPHAATSVDFDAVERKFGRERASRVEDTYVSHVHSDDGAGLPFRRRMNDDFRGRDHGTATNRKGKTAELDKPDSRVDTSDLEESSKRKTTKRKANVKVMDAASAISDPGHLEAMTDRESSRMLSRELADVWKTLGPEQAGDDRDTARYSAATEESFHALREKVEVALENMNAIYASLLEKTRGGAHDSSSRLRPLSGADAAVSAQENSDDMRAGGRSNNRRSRTTDHGVSIPTQPGGGPESGSKDDSSYGATQGGVTVAVGSSNTSGEARSEDGSSGRGKSAGRAEGREAADGSDSDDAGGAPKQRGRSNGVVKGVLSALAGMVFVAAMGLMVAGLVYGGREQEAAAATAASTSVPRPSREPLYPPRGPSFV